MLIQLLYKNNKILTLLIILSTPSCYTENVVYMNECTHKQIHTLYKQKIKKVKDAIQFLTIHI